MIALSQLGYIGLSEQEVRSLTANRHLHRIHCGVYAVGHSKLTPKGIWKAATLAGGPDAVLSHRPAGMLWKALKLAPSLPEVTVTTKGRSRPGIRFHTANLRPADRMVIDGIPVTSPARTIFDLASQLDPHHLEAALAEMEFHQRPTLDQLPTLLAQNPGARGTRALRALIESGSASLGVLASELEIAFAAFLDRHELSRPERNARLRLGDETIKPDCFWRSAGVIAELDGRASHERNRTFGSDRRRDRRGAALLGLTPLRITWPQVTGPEQTELAADLRALGV